MTKVQLARRDALLARHDAATARWPKGEDQRFVDELNSVGHDLEALAHEADEHGGDPLERARTWRFAGLAYMDAAVGHRDLSSLTSAARAFEAADALIAHVTDPVEKLKLEYAYGRTQFRLSRGTDLTLAAQACHRLTTALELARRFMPALVRPVEEALVTAQEGFEAVQEGARVNQEIVTLGARLWQEHQREVQAGTFSPTRQPVIGGAVKKLYEATQQETPDMTASMNRRNTIREAAHRLVQSGFDSAAESMPPHSQAAAVWNLIAPLKAALFDDYFEYRKSQHFADETKVAAQELHNRFVEAETLLRQHADDEPWVRRYERNALRPLALDVQTYLLRNHLTVARPVWPSSSRARQASTAFYSGGEQVMNLVAGACQDIGLELQRLPAAASYASARWEALRSSQIGVFDFTAYSRVDLESLDLSTARAVAAVSYELGMALTIGYPVVIIAAEDQGLPFDLDISAIRLPEPFEMPDELPEALEGAVYGMQRRECGNSLEASRLYLRRSIDAHGIASVRDALESMDETVNHNAIKLRGLAESVMGWAGDAQMEILFPCWPGNYPDSSRQKLFHVTPFGPAWANHTMEIVSEACAHSPAGVSYVRDDLVLDPDVIVSIWNHLCSATHIVVDLTGLNPNVALELGMAHTLGRNTLLVSQDEPAEATFLHLAKARVHRYTLGGSSPRSLRKVLDQFLSTANLRNP